MSRFHSYLNSAVTIISLYKGAEPFPIFIKKHFAAHKKFGSTDRKLVSHLCYCYFRLGKALPDLPDEEKVLTGLFLCSNEPNKLLEELKPEWYQKADLPVNEKISFLELTGSVFNIFPFHDDLSDSVNREEFVLSHLQQPDLFLRIRPGKEKNVMQKLQKSGIQFIVHSESCIALSNSSKVEDIIELNKEVVVQDYSSQRIAEFLELAKDQTQISVWDCCAASGGKSILANDILGDIELIVSDVRESILINLEKRFYQAGIKNYEAFVADLSKPLSISLSSFKLIIADVPCTGSGTWGRSPEQLFYFEIEKIEEYASLQKKIISHVISQLEPGGHLLYITCSVFKKENEDAVDFIKEKFNLEMVKMDVLKGYDKKADTMFAALLKKPL